jgi:hypothetical protein
MMKERPILFSAPMVRALLAGRKTQTRRVVKPQPHVQAGGAGWDALRYFGSGDRWCWSRPDGKGSFVRAIEVPGYEYLKCPYGQTGDRLWVRETWRPGMHTELLCAVQYRADLSWRKPDITDENQGFEFATKCADEPEEWTPSIFMHRWASRITLEITGVRVERLQAITEEDARAEGITDGGCLNCGENEPCGCRKPEPCARDSYIHLWNRINGNGAWDQNPFIWVIEFKRVEATK